MAFADALAHERDPCPAALLLAGRLGEGRRYFALRAVEQLRSRGLTVFYIQIDLDGYEPDQPDLAAYAGHIAAKRGEPAASPGQTAPAAAQPALNDFLAAAMIAACDAHRDDLAKRIAAAFESPEPWTTLAQSLADDERLVAHVVDTAELPSTARELLLELSEQFPRWKTVISCLPEDGLGKLVRARENLRFEVMPLDPGELRGLLERRCAAPGLPQSFHDELWEQTGGVRGLVAAAIESRIADGVLDPAAAAPSVHPERLLERAAESLEPDDAKRLSSFVSLAAMCGDNVPVGDLLEYLGVEPDALDDWIDRLDETVGADSAHAMFADRFQHPSLPGRTVYGFSSGAFALRLRNSFSPEGRQRLALELMRFLGQRLPVSSRAAARFYAELARWADLGEQRLELERELAWWVGPAELERMSAIISAELADGHRSASTVWTTVNTVQFGWPPQRTLALLETVRAEGLPPHLRAAHATLLSGLLLQLDRPAEALAAAQTGVEQSSDDRLLESALWERVGRARLALGQQQEAQEPFARAAKLQEQLLDEGDRRVAPLLQAYAQALRQAGRAPDAERLEAKLAALEK